jgi:hypothetical protein
MKRLFAKFSLIALIVIGASSMIFFVLPQYFEITEKVTYTGFPTYSCTEPFEISTCLNKTKLDGYMFSNTGLEVIDVRFKP